MIFCISHLHSGFRQVDSDCKLLAEKYVRVMRLLKSSFQLLELEVSKSGPGINFRGNFFICTSVLNAVIPVSPLFAFDGPAA